MAYKTALALYSGQPQQVQSGDILTDRRWVDINRCGFADNSQTSLSFNDSTYTLTLTDTGSGWQYYRAGVVCSISGNKTATLSGTPPAKNTYYIYIDATDGTLTASTSAWTLLDTKIPVAIIIWDNALTPKYQMADERHTCLIDRRQHYYEHTIEGTRYISGGVPSGYGIAPATPADTDNVFAISAANCADEDLLLSLASLTKPNGTATDFVVFYRTAASTWAWKASAMPYDYTAAGYINYDNGGTATQGQHNKYYNSYLIYTNLSGAARYICVNGRAEFASLAAAQGETPGAFDWAGIGIAEFVIAYQFTWQTQNTYSTKGLCRLAAAPVKRIVSVIQTSIAATSAHNALSGLQGGATNEYYHLTSAQTGQLVTNGDSHDHSGGDGAQINHTTLSNIGTNTHAQIDSFIAVAGSVYQAANGRLTLTSGTAVTTADVTAATSVYYTPYNGNRIALYNGSAWEIKTFTELTLSLSSATADKNSDIFIYDNSGTLTLEKVEWTNDTTRATALVLQDGVYVKTGATGRRYLGTIRTTGTTGQTEDSLSKRYIWNCYNAVVRRLFYADTTASWTYNSTTTWRQARGQSAAQVGTVIGLAGISPISLSNSIIVLNGYVGIGIDSTSTIVVAGLFVGTGTPMALNSYIPEIGYHYFTPMEMAQTGYTATYYGGGHQFSATGWA